jgi:hypothetical protein
MTAMVRALLALLALCGNVPGAVQDVSAGGNMPAGAGVQKGGDGVGGIDFKPRPNTLPGSSKLKNPHAPPPIESVHELGHGPWTNLGFGLPGSAGVPQLAGMGTGEPSTPIGLRVSGGPAYGTAMIVLGLEVAAVPFHGGLIVPRPDLILTGLPLGTDGQLMLSTMLPTHLPPDLVMYMQVWMPDTTAPSGWSATNALRLITH